MKIAFDSWPLALRFRHQGTFVYAANLIAEFRKVAARCPDVEFCVFGSRAGCELPEYLQPSPGFSLVRSGWVDHERLWRLCGASLEGKRTGADLMFSPSCNVIPIGKLPMVCTIHDVTPMVMPSNSRRIVLAQKLFLSVAARRSVAIMTVSECSKRDLIEHCGVVAEKITVVYNGYDRQYFNSAPADPEKLAELRARFGIRENYVFHHGVIQPRKNLQRLIEAWELLLSRHPDIDFDLVLAGPWGWQHERVLRAGEASSGRRGKVVCTGRLSSEDLAQLIKGSSLEVIPSLYEGFCLPMVEAMACGVPTIVSDGSCFREISGGRLLYFDPLSLEDMAAKIETGLFDSRRRNELIAGGLRGVSGFSWERCARETLETLMRVGGKRVPVEASA